ncbi:MAG: TIR domain-containing protein, partial [Bacteroidetes bacterium]|nr:TIR domain-containing protein [Bacteroidota bacterium]
MKRLAGYETQISDLSPILPFIEKGIKITLNDDTTENEFNFRDCPLTNPPIEIVEQGNEAILKYFADKAKQGEEKLYEAKIVVVGAGESGKTTLIQKLLNPAHPVPNPADKRTEGIHVTSYPFRGEVKGAAKGLTAYLWDFGGQELYHATHQFFLTPDTLYVLLNDNRKNDTDFYYWLNIVRLRAGDGCPILMVFNAKDKSPRQIVPGEELFAAFPSVVQQPLDVDFADKDFGVFERMKGTVESHFTNLEVLGRPYPALWVQAREALGKLTDERITYTKFQEVCQSKGITDEDSMRILAQTLHNLGVLLYFPDVFGLENLVILQPQWCIDAIYKAFDTESILSKDGRFTEKTLADCWRHDARFREHSLQLLKLMQQFDLCYPVEGSRDEYIAPQLLPLEENRLPDFPSRHAIHVRFEYTFMPAGMLTSLIARLSRHIRSPHVWRTGVTLAWEEGTLAELTEQAFSRQINIKVVGPERQRRLSEIRKVLFDIHQRFKGLKYEELAACPCPDCADKPGATMFEFKELEDNARHNDDMTCRNGRRKKIPAKQILQGIDYTDHPRIFISYAHKNEALKDEFREMISPMERNGKWKVWDDRYILPNDDWNDEILRHLSEANVIVLMLTPAFFKSNFIYDIEFSRAIQRHESGDALVVGIVVD